MKVVVAGVGAFGQKHLDALKKIDGVEVVSIVGRQIAPTQEVAKKYGVTAGRISQLRRVLEESWAEFQGEAAPATA